MTRTEPLARRRVTGVILAGGNASRLGGSAKGLERVGSARMIDRVAAALHSVTDDLLLVANDPLAAEWLPGVTTITDLHAGNGPAAGVHAALVHVNAPVLVVAWDMPFVPPSLLLDLQAIGEETGADAVVPASDGRHGLEPLCCYYSVGCIAPIAGGIGAGERSLAKLLASVNTVILDRARVATHGDPRIIFYNVNTPEELACSQELADGRFRQ
ncbi:MAG: molybdenum cofactor guanylyltransferase [Gemmatimonas sp.]